MAQVVGGVVGAAVGFFVGGPAGAQWGWAIGSAIGNSFTTIKQPRIGDLAEIRAGEGGPRARVYGTFRPIGGQVVWSGAPREIRRRERQGKGGPKVESSTILRSYAIGICEGPITSVSRIWRNNELVYDVRPESEMLAESAKWIEGKTILLGDWDQLPHPTIEAEAGAGNAPAMRGTALLVVTDEDLTDLRGAIPAYQFEVGASVCPQVPGGVQRDTFEATHPDATIRATADGVYATSGPIGTFSGQSVQFLDLSNALTSVSDRGYTGGSVPAPGANAEFFSGSAERLVLSEDGNNGVCGLFDAGTWRAYLYPNNTVPDGWFFNALQNRSDCVWWSDTHVFLCFTTSSATPAANDAAYRIYRWPLTATGAKVLPDATSIRLNTGVPAPNMLFHRDREGNIHAYSVEDNLWRIFSADLGLISSFSPPTAVGRPIGADGLYFFHSGVSTLVPGQSALFVRRKSDWSLVQEIQLPYFNGALYQGSINWGLSFNDSTIVVQARNRAVTIDYVGDCGTPTEGNQSSLAAIVSAICADAKLQPSLVDVSALPAIGVPGFATSPDYTAASAIQELSKIYFFDPQDADGRIRFIPRGGDFRAILTEDEFVDGENEPEADTTRDSISVPRLLHLSYFDVEGGQGADKQFSERQISPRTDAPTVLSTPVVLDAETAAKSLRVQHQVMEEELRGDLVFGVSDKYIGLTEADTIVAQYRGRSQRARITKVVMNDGWQQLTCLRDRQSAYNANPQAVPPAVVTRPPSTIVGATRFAFLDIPALTQAGDVLGYHIATSGEVVGWRGAAVERQEGSEFGLLATDGGGTVMGTLTAALPLASEWYPDETNTLAVQLARSDDELEAIDTATWLARGNAAAILRADGTAEIVQFRNAVETSPGVWALSGLQRGRLNTGASAHAIGATFVLLDGALFVQTGSERLASTLTHRAYSVGNLPSSATALARTWTGRSQREWPPIIETATRAGDTLAVTWTPRHRFGSDENPVASSHFDGWQVDATSGGTTRTATVLTPTASIDVTGLTNPITVTVRGRNRLAGLGDPATRIIP
mgnify:CR=1 FL=1